MLSYPRSFGFIPSCEALFGSIQKIDAWEAMANFDSVPDAIEQAETFLITRARRTTARFFRDPILDFNPESNSDSDLEQGTQDKATHEKHE